MSTVYEVEGPDGVVYEVEGPEGASDADIIAAVQAQIGGQQSAAPQEPMSSEAIQSELNKMVAGGRPGAEIVSFIDSQGRPLEDADRAWLLGDYEKARASGKPIQRPFNVAPQPDEREETGAGEALWAGVRSGALRGWDDEWAALAGAAGNKLGTALGLNESTADFWDIYDTLQQQEQEKKNRAWEDRPGWFSAGFLPGSLTGPAFARTSVGGRGAIEGSISAAGNTEEGDLGQRALNSLGGAAGGYVAARALDPLLRGAGTITSRVRERLGFGPNARTADSGLEALAARTGLDPADLAARRQELEDLGFQDITLLDLLDETGRGVVSAAANRGTAANTDLARFADDVYVSAQDRIADQAGRYISDSPVTAAQAAEATTGLRDTTMEAAMEPIRNEAVPITDEILEILGTREGVAALRGAQGFMTNAADRAGVDNILSAVREIQKLNPRLPENIRRQIARQLLQGTNLTVDVADKFARAMQGRGGRTPGLERVATNFSRAVRDAARRQSSGYDEALTNYSAASGVIDAARGTGRFEGSDFLRGRPDRFASVVDEAGTGGPRFVDELGEESFGLSEFEALRMRARDEIANRAQEGSGAGAMGVARQLSRGSNQARRNEALLGPQDADRLQRAMAAEVNRVDATRYVDPRIGSDTFRRMQQQEASMAGDAVIETAASAGFSPWWTLVRATGKFLQGTGMRNVDAERLVRDAIDPARTNDAIAFLVQRGMPRNQAQQTIRTIQQSMRDGRLQGRLAGEVVGDERQRTPGSVRSMSTRTRIEE